MTNDEAKLMADVTERLAESTRKLAELGAMLNNGTGVIHVLNIQLAAMMPVVAAAVDCVNNPAWIGVCDEDVILEQHVHEYMRQMAMRPC